jgi:hypothetical protein
MGLGTRVEIMQEFDKIYFRQRSGALLEALKKRKFDAAFFETPEEAKKFVLQQIKPEESVGIGGSITLREKLKIVQEIRHRGNLVYDHWEADNEERRIELKRRHRSVDVFLSSTNALVSDGTLVNLDGGGNRVASLCSGPKRVIVVAGVNKLVESIDEGIKRTRNRAAVLRVLKSHFRTPCDGTGVCTDCNSPQRICSALLILMQKPADIEQFIVILVNENMGY